MGMEVPIEFGPELLLTYVSNRFSAQVSNRFSAQISNSFSSPLMRQSGLQLLLA